MTAERGNFHVHTSVGAWIDQVQREPTNVGPYKAAYAEAVYDIVQALTGKNGIAQEPLVNLLGAWVREDPQTQREITIGAGHCAAALLEEDRDKPSAKAVSRQGIRAPLGAHVDVVVSLFEKVNPQVGEQLRESTTPLTAITFEVS